MTNKRLGEKNIMTIIIAFICHEAVVCSSERAGEWKEGEEGEGED